MDKFGVLWTRHNGVPRKLADMVLTPSELRITKHPNAADLPGPSLIHDKLGISTIEYKRDQWRHLPPQLEALLPPANRDNPQRVILSRLLSRHIDTRGMPIIEQEWEMLLFAGRNGVGHLDAFPSDLIAERFYAKAPLPTIKANAASGIWACFKRIAEDTAKDDNEIDEIVRAIGPTPGISGFNPKLFVALDIVEGKWTGGIAPETGLPAIVKVEPERYPGLLPLEALAYELHEQAGIPTPKFWLREIDFQGEKFPILAIERFDREKNGTPIPLESVFSLLRTGSPTKFYETTDGTMEDAWNAIKYVTANQLSDRLNLFSRFALSLLTGNGDLHLENWSVLGPWGNAGMSPVYDPAPMRAYRVFRSNHDLLSALSFSGIGGTRDAPYASSGEIPPDLGTKLVKFGESLGLANRTCLTRLAELLKLSVDYPQKAVAVLESVPAIRRKPKAPDITGFQHTLAELHKSLGSALT
jgi:serine/threonine-protein kinase HipA